MRHGTLTVVLLMLTTGVVAQNTAANLGILTCTVDAIQGQSRTMTCGFKSTESGGDGRYVGTLQGGVSEPPVKRVLVWTVIGPANLKISPGVLSQRFAVGTKAGSSSSELVGQADSSIILQAETSNPKPGDAATQIELKLVSTPA